MASADSLPPMLPVGFRMRFASATVLVTVFSLSGQVSSEERLRARLPSRAPSMRDAAASRSRSSSSPPAGTTSSTRPMSWASAGPSGRPEVMTLMACLTPTSRGRRCVPPAPGRMPSFTSGSESVAPSAATRAWQPMATSRPPPMALPWMAATTGLEQSSSASHTSGSTGASRARPLANSLMSAPPLKPAPAPLTMTPRTSGSASARCTPCSSASRISLLSALTGGLQSSRMATCAAGNRRSVYRTAGPAMAAVGSMRVRCS
mmetsp:Transcript_27940/g.88997  ORF Transcript_27940/g.88997 Transcript_27940/m.88997 type:complete len:262 (+) Transcript_27940:1871-2656(+)